MNQNRGKKRTSISKKREAQPTDFKMNHHGLQVVTPIAKPQSLGPLGISEQQSLLPDPETDPDIKIEGGKDPQDEPKTNKQKTFCRIK